MTLLEHTSTSTTRADDRALQRGVTDATEAGSRTTSRLDHPAFGHANRATVSPITVELYRVTLGDTVIGYLEAAGPVWVALSGALYPRAVETGQHRLFAAALKILTDPS